MKIDDILPFFNNYNVTIELAEETRKKYEKLVKELDLNTKYNLIRVENNEDVIVLFCEELTNFLEKLSIHIE